MRPAFRRSAAVRGLTPTEDRVCPGFACGDCGSELVQFHPSATSFTAEALEGLVDMQLEPLCDHPLGLLDDDASREGGSKLLIFTAQGPELVRGGP